jgi:hypothetical protein
MVSAMQRWKGALYRDSNNRACIWFPCEKNVLAIFRNEKNGIALRVLPAHHI